MSGPIAVADGPAYSEGSRQGQGADWGCVFLEGAPFFGLASSAKGFDSTCSILVLELPGRFSSSDVGFG